MEQRTDDWLAWRRQGVCASEAPIIMGVSPYTNIVEWWRDKMGLPPLKPRNEFILKRGTDVEPVARARYELTYNREMKPALWQSNEKPIFRASLDGCNVKLNRGLELKYSGLEDFTGVGFGIVPAKYMPQVQAQLYCTGFEIIDFYSYYLPKQYAKDPDFFHKGKGACLEVRADLPYIAEFVQRGEFYWDFVTRGVEPPYVGKPKRKKKVVA